MDNEEFKEYMEEYIRELDLETERLEILGASLISLGYLIICYGARIDIYDVLTNNEIDITSAEVTVFGQLVVVIGYSILWVVAKRRIYSRTLRNEYLDENNFIPSFKKLETGYTLSIFANLLRLEAFYEILLNREINTDDNYE